MAIIEDVMTAFPETLGPDDSVHKAAQKMRDGDYGAIPIVDDLGVLVGIVTDRDIVLKAVAEGRDKDTPVQHCMTRNPDTVAKDTTVDQAMTVMASQQLHRLPVMENGRLIGMVSLSDLLVSDATMQEKVKLAENVSASGERQPVGTTFMR